MTTIWVVYTEWQNGEPNIDGLFTSEARAREVRARIVEEFKTGSVYGVKRQVYGEPDTDEDDADWDVDVHCEPYSLEVTL